ncbi:hypothetical protein LSAT2_009361 [Lamellibrachia satsuma]|nr:hypothetical protein LSAT2_009361 [Lamellibrachia satsuma]
MAALAGFEPPRMDCVIDRTSESADEFMTLCKLQPKKCQFRDARETDERLIEQLIVGIKHAKIQEKLLGRDDTLTLDSAVDIART